MSLLNDIDPLTDAMTDCFLAWLPHVQTAFTSIRQGLPGASILRVYQHASVTGGSTNVGGTVSLLLS